MRLRPSARRLATGVGALLAALLVAVAPAGAFVTQTVLDLVPDFADGAFRRTGLINIPAENISGVQLMPIGLSGEWVLDQTSLPVPLQEMAAHAWGNWIYVVGGRLSNGQASNRVFRFTVAEDGRIASVTEHSPLPVGLIGAQTFLRMAYGAYGDAYLYVVGGLIGGTQVSRKVYRAPISIYTGALGQWTALQTELPFGLFYSAIAQKVNDVYLIGGIAYSGTYATVSNVFRTTILMNGEITPWDSYIGPGGTVESELPPSFSAGVAAARAIIYQDDARSTIYLMGGRSQASGQVDSSALVAVAAADIDRYGNLSEWKESGAHLPVPIHGHGAVLVGNSEILLAGGRTDPSDPEAGIQSNVQAALIDPDNPEFPLYDWNPDPDEWNVWQTGVPFPDGQVRAYHGLVKVGDWIYALGGSNAANTPTSTIYRGRLSGVGALYAPDGVYESPTMTLYDGTDPSAAPDLMRVEWQAVLPVGSLHMEYSWKPVGGEWTDWLELGDSVAGQNVATFSPRLESVAQFRFRATFSSVHPYDRTPRLEAVRVVYDAPPPDLAVSLSSSKPHVRPGDTVSFTAQYQNVGGVTAEGVEVVCTLPPYLTNLSSGWVEVGPHTYRFAVGTVAAGGAGSAKITAQVGQIPEGVETLETRATVSFPPMRDLDANLVADPNAANDSASVTVSATPLAITGTLSATPAAGTPVSPGDALEYRLDYTVSGGTGTSGIVISVAVDANKLVEVQPLDGGLMEGSTVRWYFPAAVPAGYQGTVRLQARVKRPLANGTEIALTYVASSNDLPAAAVASISHPVASQPRVTLQGSADPAAGSSVLRGQTITYRFVCLNDGGENASGIAVSASLPPEVQVVSVEPAGTISGQSVAWSLGNLPIDTPRELKIVGRVADTAAHGRIVTVGAQLTGTGVPAVSVQVQHTVRVPAALSIAKTVDPAQAVRPGDMLTYRVAVTNLGGEPSGPISVTDPVPSYTSDADGLAVNSMVNWSAQGLAGGQTLVFEHRVRVNDPISESITDIVAGAASASHAGVTVRSGTLRTPVQHWPNLWVTVSDGRTVVKPGDALTYSVHYGNRGGATQGVELVADLGPELEWKGGSGWQPVGDGRYRLIVGALGTEERSASFEARVSPSIDGDDPTLGLRAEVTISGADPDADPHDDRSVDVDIVSGPDLAVLSFTAVPASPFREQYLTLQVEVGNIGPSPLGPHATQAGQEQVILEVYARRAVSEPPSGPLDSIGGYCAEAGCQVTRPSFRSAIPIGSLTPGATVTVNFANLLHLTEAGLLDLYAQVDVGGDPVYGGFREGNELNNLASLRRFAVFDLGPESAAYCLPLVLRGSEW
ncbi:MAG: DUF11 domain-containing protein [Anaerolineae bacterium]|nr:DUF11 domain-containing protein [Anaerolineae bacterium]